MDLERIILFFLREKTMSFKSYKLKIECANRGNVVVVVVVCKLTYPDWIWQRAT